MIPENQLNAAEKKVLDAFREGKSGNTEAAKELEKAIGMPTVDLELKEISSDFLRSLFCEDYGKISHCKTVIFRAEISGALDMAFCETKFPIQFNTCYFSERIELGYFKSPELSLTRCGLAQGVNAHYLKIEGDVRLASCKSTGAVSLFGAEIGGQLDCAGSNFAGEKGAFIASNIKVGSTVFLSKGFKANGQVTLDNSEIGGHLHCEGGCFINKEQTALFARSIKVTSDINMRKGFKSIGGVNLRNAEIGGLLDCRGGKFMNRKENALFAQNAKVDSSVLLDEGFKAAGEVILSGVKIGGQLISRDGAFMKRREDVLTAQNARIAASVVLGPNFRAKGKVNLYGAKVIGSLSLENCRYMELRLTDTEVDTFSDDQNTYDAPGGYLHINGFRYQRLESEWEKGKQVESRLKWLDSMSEEGEFSPQPYEQLMKVYREMGHMNWARKVGFSLEEKRCKHMKFMQEPWWKLWYLLLKITIGYGYKPFKSFYWFMGFIITGCLFFGSTLLCTEYETSVKDWAGCEVWRMLPSDAKVLLSDEWKENREVIKDYPQFSPFLYAVETALPVLPLGQTDKWHPKSLWLKFAQFLITFLGTSLLAILVFYGAGTLGPRWKE